MGLEARTFRRVMASLAAGVSVVTTRDRDGRPRGFTATAVCLVSLDPQLLLVCIDRGADCHEAFREAPAFAVHLLQESQEGLSRRFASRDADKFAGLSCREGRSGVPILGGVLGHVECRAHACYPAGDHTIVVGEALDAVLAPPETAASPLLYFRGGYARLGPGPQASDRQP